MNQMGLAKCDPNNQGMLETGNLNPLESIIEPKGYCYMFVISRSSLKPSLLKCYEEAVLSS
jgi:hypothetical protein